MRNCKHCQDRKDLGFDGPCMQHDPTPDDPKLHSIGFAFVGGQDMFHGDYGTIKEQTDEMYANAKRYGNPPPEYMGKRSKMRSMKEIMGEPPVPTQAQLDAGAVTATIS